MKTVLLALVALTVAFEASAQRRPGPRPSRPAPGRVVVTGPRPAPGPGPGRVVVTRPTRPGTVVTRLPPGRVRPVGPRYNPPVTYRPPVYRTGPVVRVLPRYVPNPYSRRVLRTVVRAPIVWTQPFGYSCNQYEQLTLNGQFIHDFQFLGECSQAVQDIRIYGDFCDGEDLYDQTGVLEAQFTFNYECREALGYYY